MAGSDPPWSWPRPHAPRIRQTTKKRTTRHKTAKTDWCLSQCSYDPESKPKSVDPLRIIHLQLLPMHSHVAWLQHDDPDHPGSRLVLLEGGNSSSSSGASSSRRSTSRFSHCGMMARSTPSRCKIVDQFDSQQTVTMARMLCVCRTRQTSCSDDRGYRGTQWRGWFACTSKENYLRGYYENAMSYCGRHRIYLQPTRKTVFRNTPIHECTKNKWPLNRRDGSFIGSSDTIM